jgi:hypothetical protein
MRKMIADVLKNYEIYMDQLTPNAIVNLTSLYGLYEGKVHEPMLSVFVMNYTTRRIL